MSRLPIPIHAGRTQSNSAWDVILVLFYGLDFRLFNNGAGATCWDTKAAEQHGTAHDPLMRLALIAPLLAGAVRMSQW